MHTRARTHAHTHTHTRSVQLEDENWLHFAELEVVGSRGPHRRISPAGSVSCGRDVTAVIVKPVTDAK